MGVDCRIIAKMKDGSMAKIEQDRFTAFTDHETLNYALTEPTSPQEAVAVIGRLERQKERELYEITWLRIARKTLVKHVSKIEYIFVQTDQVDTDDYYYAVKKTLE